MSRRRRRHCRLLLPRRNQPRQCRHRMDPLNGINNNNNDDGRHRHLNTLLRHLLLLIALFLHPMRPPAATKAFEQASKMLEELRTVLVRLDHLLIKITPNIDDNIIIPQINIHTTIIAILRAKMAVSAMRMFTSGMTLIHLLHCHHQHQIHYHHNLYHHRRQQHHQPS